MWLLRLHQSYTRIPAFELFRGQGQGWGPIFLSPAVALVNKHKHSATTSRRLLGRLRHELHVRRLLGAVLLLARVEAAPPAQPSEREPAPAPPRGPRRPPSRGVSPRPVRSSAASYVAAGTGVARRSSGAAAAGDGVAMRVASAGRHGGRGSMRRRHPPLVVEQLLRGRVGERGG